MICFGYHLRIYPGKFGEAILHLREDLLASRVDHDYPSPIPPGPETVAATKPDEDNLFQQADLMSVVAYLRAGKGLDLPQCWRDIIPKPSIDVN